MTEYVKIKCDDCKFREECADYGWQGCRKFTPKPNEPMTNEEWLKGLSTKRMANFLSRVTQKCNDCGVDSLGDMDVKCPYNCGFCNKNAVEEWLKQPHTEKE